MSRTTITAPFSRAVVNAMRKLYPEDLADKSWDNTGLLLEAPFDPITRQMNSVLLTVDLTKAVADEAIERNDSIVVAYHPIIFRGLKSITLADTQQQSLLRLAAEGISVYSPHTAIDAADGGLGDWLADIITGTPITRDGEDELSLEPIPENPPDNEASITKDPFPSKDTKSNRPSFLLQHHPSQHMVQKTSPKPSITPHTRKPIKPLNPPHPSHPNGGMGRLVHFESPQPLSLLIERIATGVGNPKGFPIAIPQGASIDSVNIRSVGICAGSGGSLFAGLDTDLLFTGELSHHEALAAIERGQCVVTLFHSNTERGFLHNVLKLRLKKAVEEEWGRLRREERGRLGEEAEEALDDGDVSVEVSERDRDPYGIVISRAEL
ncbi:NGG1p interacting factor 3 [Patellaria atrata CBS 101060]|uniref:NGG1p interacting factor 3 n=1 Tax=Patellaria atrata CBS 101060 TaxID=1346257 RepID=A0A9P4S4R9_9PEZI|nr:NGG1p interacting factor 3 [Patellaria atrata CBS 101060]